MAFMRLPTELFVQVFLYLDNIDDALHLGRCCRTLYAILDTYRLDIMKSAILSSRTHQYDIKLCHMIDVWNRTAASIREAGDGDPESQFLPSVATFDACMQAEMLHEQHVWDIVVRWQGLRPYEHFYTDPNINRAFRQCPYDVGEQFTLHSPQVDIGDLACATNPSDRPDTFNSDERERFYTAMTRYWLGLESLRIGRACICPNNSTQIRVIDTVRRFWHGPQDVRAVHETLEVFEFIYIFLLQQTSMSNLQTFTEWFSEAEDVQDPRETPHSNLSHLLHSAWTLLNPADILEVLSLESRWKLGQSPQWSTEQKWDYIVTRGFRRESSPLIADVSDTPETWFSRCDLEDGCEIQATASHEDDGEAWRQFRECHWQDDSRGKFAQIPTPMFRRLVLGEEHEGADLRQRRRTER